MEGKENHKQGNQEASSYRAREMPAAVQAPLRPGFRYALQGVLGESSGAAALR